MVLLHGKKPLYGGIFDFHDIVIIAHAVTACIAVTLLLPIGILIARFRRNSPHWFRLHAGFLFLSLVFTFASFACAVIAVESGGKGTQFSDKTTVDRRHHKFGLSVVLVMLVQASIGLVAHFTKGANANTGTRRSVLRWFHIGAGIVTTALLYAAVYDGFFEWDITSDSGTMVPTGVRAVFWVLFGLAVIAWFAGLVLEARKKPVADGKDSVEEKF